MALQILKEADITEPAGFWPRVARQSGQYLAIKRNSHDEQVAGTRSMKTMYWNDGEALALVRRRVTSYR